MRRFFEKKMKPLPPDTVGTEKEKRLRIVVPTLGVDLPKKDRLLEKLRTVKVFLEDMATAVALFYDLFIRRKK